MKQGTNRLIHAGSLLLLLLFAGATTSTSAQGTAFTYQGRLQDGGTNANGNYDLQFTIWDALSGGTPQPEPAPVTVTKSGVVVANGVFTVQLDFGAAAFPGANRFLETTVRLANIGSFTLLSPRQPITSTPYALRSASSSTADVATNSTQLGGVVASQYVVTSDSRLSDSRAPTTGSANYIQNTTAQQAGSNFNVSGNGTTGGTLSGNVVNSTSQFNLAGNRVLSAPGTNNLFAGVGAGAANTSGNFNAFFGSSAGAANTSGASNSFFGYRAGSAITTGLANAFFGQGAGVNSTTANDNSFFGSNAGVANTTGGENSFFGTHAGFNTNTGTSNAFFGYSAGTANTSGDDNTFMGAAAGPSNTTGMFNSFFGYLTGMSHTTGNGNTLIGYQTGGSNVSGDNNTGLGNLATFGSSNLTNATSIGANARVDQSNSLVLGSINGINSATASTNVGIGTTAPTERLHVVGNGLFTGNLTAAGVLNLNGQLALSNAGTQNLFAGSGAGQTNTGTNNAFFGYQAGVMNSSGNDNAFFGRNAGSANTTNSFNAYFGFKAGVNGDACCNSMFGTDAGASNTTGQNNSFFGMFAGHANISGFNNTAIGEDADFDSSSLINATAIGFKSMVSQDNSLVLGGIRGVNGSGTSTSVGIGTTSPLTRLHVVGDTSLVGNVGIGTDSPAGPLTVVQATNGDGVVSTTAFLATLTGTATLFTSFFHVGDTITVSGETARTITSISSDTSLAVSSAFSNSASNRTYTLTGATLMIVKSGGNVGIGTTAPVQPLHVVGNGVLTGSLGIGATSPAVALEVQRNSTIASDWQTGQLRISGASDPNMQLSLGYDTSSNLGVIQAGQAFTGFKTLLLNPSGGNVGVGTSAPDQKLTVNGGASKPGGGSWATFSDERLKNIKGRFTPGLRAVMQLQPIRYQYKPDNALGIKAEGEHIGFSAQAVQKIIPEAVTKDEKGYLLVNNDPIIWTMLNAIKEQQNQIEQQHQQIEVLKKLVCRSHRRAVVCR